MTPTGATIADDFTTVQKKKKKMRACIAPLHPKPPIMAREGKTSTGILSGGSLSLSLSLQDGKAVRQAKTAAAKAA